MKWQACVDTNDHRPGNSVMHTRNDRSYWSIPPFEKYRYDRLMYEPDNRVTAHLLFSNKSLSKIVLKFDRRFGTGGILLMSSNAETY